MDLKNNLIKEAIVGENTYCVSPWNEIHINAFGKVRFCCQHTGINANVNSTTLQQAFHGTNEYKVARKQVMSNVWPKGCNMCISDEKAQQTSTRIDNYNSFKDDKKLYKDFGQNIQKIGIDFSNSCNLRCTMCDPFKSTGWYKDAKLLEDKLGDEVIRAITKDARPSSMGGDETSEFGLPLDFVDKNLETLLDSHVIDCGGGEPFFMPRFIYLVDKLVEHNYKGKLKIITNMTLLEDKIVKKLKKLSNVNLVVSLDGINDLYPYMRPSTPFGKYKGKTIQDRIIKYQNVFNIGISYTPQLMNVYNIKEYIEWLIENISSSEWCSSCNYFNKGVTEPRYLRISVHPDVKYKNELADWLEGIEDENNHLQSLIYQLRMPRSERDIDDWKFFCKTIDILDKYRKTSILKYVPKLEKYWIKA